MWRLVSLLDNPQAGLPCVHIGGTSGKGSTATMTAAILCKAGIATGLHVKPHLSSVTERFVVNLHPIDAGSLVRLIEEAAPAARLAQPTWHEFTVALALRHFSRQRVAAVIEVGLGGDFDSTNVVEPAVAVVTNIGLDHTEILGNTLAAIARTKSGIIKRGAITVTAERNPEALAEIEARCRSQGVELWRADRDFDWHVVTADARGTTVDLTLPGLRLAGVRLQLLGNHQAENAALAAAAACALRRRGWPISDEAICRGLESATIPGRLEVVRRSPFVLLDGAHSPPKMAALASALQTIFPCVPITALLAAKRGHDTRATLGKLAPLLADAVVTEYDAAADFGPHSAVDAGELAMQLKEVGGPSDIVVEPNVARAFALAMARTPREGALLVTGSIYLVGQVSGWLVEPAPLDALPTA